MKITVLIPHFKSKITAYSISQFLKYKGKHEVDIIVINNSVGHESIEYLTPFLNDVLVVDNETDKITSHGTAYDLVLSSGLVKSDYFLTAESDSFCIKPDWLDYYEKLTQEGYDIIGSTLQLSGGSYIHCGSGAMYSKRLWDEAKVFCDNVPYTYFPNMSRKYGFDCHLMVHNGILKEVLDKPDDWVNLAAGYIGLSKEQMLKKAEWYSPVNQPFHFGMGGLEETLSTYGLRCAENDAPTITLEKARKIIHRIGYEPSQFLNFFAVKTNKNIKEIPIRTVWIPDRKNQQQGYTINEAGIKHIWAGSSFIDMKGTDFNDVYEFKKSQIDELYNSLPENKKVKV